MRRAHFTQYVRLFPRTLARGKVRDVGLDRLLLKTREAPPANIRTKLNPEFRGVGVQFDDHVSVLEHDGVNFQLHVPSLAGSARSDALATFSSYSFISEEVRR